MKFFILSFFISLLVTLLVVRSARRHAALLPDHQMRPQNYHSSPVPRIGGVALLVAALCSFLWAQTALPGEAAMLWALMVAALPAFLSGVLEDLYKNVSPRVRLLCNAASAGLGIWLLGAVLTRTAIPGIDPMIQWYPAAVALTVFAVTGVANAINIIDGFNGLASMCVLFMLLALAYVAFQVGDSFVFTVALIVSGSVLGVFVWNYPAGLVFLGDGGAYFLGFVLAELSILLIGRNSGVSPIFPLLLCAYPIFETLFSIYRRRFVRGVAAIAPDGIHLHTLIHRRIIRAAFRVDFDRRQIARNSMTSPYLWALCLLSVIPSVLWWDNTLVLTLFLFLFMVSYVVLYCLILKFKTPKWLMIRRGP